MDRKIRVVLVDDHKGARDALRMIIEKEADMEVVGEAADGEEAISISRKLNPGVIVMDIRMPKMDGATATELILREMPNTRIIAASMYSDQVYLSKILKAGARGVIMKDEAFLQLPKVIRKAVEA